jgi:hypothetical protein
VQNEPSLALHLWLILSGIWVVLGSTGTLVRTFTQQVNSSLQAWVFSGLTQLQPEVCCGGGAQSTFWKRPAEFLLKVGVE